MKIIIALSFVFSLNTILNAQVKKSEHNNDNIQFASSGITGLQINTNNKALNSLNKLLEKNNLPTLTPVLFTAGLSFMIKHNDNKSRMAFEISYAESLAPKEALTDANLIIPKIIGGSFTGISTQKLWERKRFRLEGGLGMGVSKYNIKLIDRKNFQVPLDTLLKYPTQSSASLNFSQKQLNWNLEGRLGITYDTQWFKNVAYAYEFSFFINYSQSVFTSKTWVLSGTNIPVANFPKIDFSNVRFVLANNIFFKYPNKKTRKVRSEE
jgi:hypothetical protein